MPITCFRVVFLQLATMRSVINVFYNFDLPVICASNTFANERLNKMLLIMVNIISFLLV